MDSTQRTKAKGLAQDFIKSAALPGTSGQSVLLDSAGEYLSEGRQGLNYLTDNEDRYKAQMSGQYRLVGRKKAEEFNRALKADGLYLTPGENNERSVVGYRQVGVKRMSGDPLRSYRGNNPEASYQWVPVYGEATAKTAEPAPAPSGPVDDPEGDAIIAKGQAAEDALYGRTGNSRPSMMSPGGYTPYDGIRSMASFADKLQGYSQQQIGLMDDVADASRYQSGRILSNWVTGLPKAPELPDEDEMISLINRAAQEIQLKPKKS